MKKKLNVSHADVINAMFKKIKIGLTKYKYNQKITHLDHLDTGILIVRPIFKLVKLNIYHWRESQQN